MKIIIKELNDTERERMHQICISLFLTGHCYALAIALSRGTGWPIYGIIKDGLVWHAGVRDENERFWDARGRVDDGKIGEPFGLGDGLMMRQVTEEELQVTKFMNEIVIHRASVLAQMIWPNLPWNREAYRTRVLSFIRELDEISRKHQVWIRSEVPNRAMVVDQMDGREGFQVEPSATGQYFLKRYFESEQAHETAVC